jgi:hypothetical protein
VYRPPHPRRVRPRRRPASYNPRNGHRGQAIRGTRGDEFDRSVTNFAIRYADQNERDYAEFVAAIRSGQLTAVEGV